MASSKYDKLVRTLIFITEFRERALSFLILLLLPLLAQANGDPVATYCALTLSKVPVPRAIPEIQIERENLDITLEYGQARISVDYVLHNTSGKSFRDIHYGFPVDWEGDSLVHWIDDFYSESQYQKGWSDYYVRDFSFSLNGKPLTARMSGDTVVKPAYTNIDWHNEFGYPDWKNEDYDTTHHKFGDSNDRYNWYQEVAEYEWNNIPKKPYILEHAVHRRWYYTSFSLRAHAQATLHVEYTLKHLTSLGLYQLGNEFQHAFDCHENNWNGGERSEADYNRFLYDFSPAAAWGDGTTRELNLTVHAPNTKVWLPQISGNDPPLFEGYYHQHYTDFRYADAAPIEWFYTYPAPDSLDVNAIRDHRLSSTCYSLRQYEGDTCNYKVLSDLNGCTGIFLSPTDSGDYVLDIIVADSINVTGLAILHGNYCDSISWATTPRAEKMKVDCLVTTEWEKYPYWINEYGTTEWITSYIKGNHYPALCKTAQPSDFTWPSLVRAMEKMNLGDRGFDTPWGFFERYKRFTNRIRIHIPPQPSAPFISEVILLSTRNTPCK
ncbi:MAG: hypothetical protein IJS49_04255 [Paludibacteraceae bacterium]|nr:hypothetical protein [Paludibacteraceae bacterium]